MKRKLHFYFRISMLFAFTFIMTSLTLKGQDSIKLDAAEDSFTRAGSKSDANYGDKDYMQAATGEGSNLHEIYLKYDLSSISDLSKIESATLNLIPFGTKWGEDGSTTWVSYIMDDTWSEATLTYNTRPAVTEDSLVGVVTTSARGETVETIHTIDVTDIVKAEADMILSLKVGNSLLAPDVKANYHTKEFTEGGAYLEITFKGNGTSVSDLNSRGISVYPNPSTDIITISSPEMSLTKVELYNLMGQLIKSEANLKGVSMHSLSVNDLEAGSYLVKAYTLDGSVSCKSLLKE